MKLASLQIENFRCFRDETIFFDNYTCLVGPNGAGKSTILTALNMFFRVTSNTSTDLLSLVKEDFHLGDTAKPISITVTFCELSKGAEADFKDYVRQGEAHHKRASRLGCRRRVGRGEAVWSAHGLRRVQALLREGKGQSFVKRIAEVLL